MDDKFDPVLTKQRTLEMLSDSSIVALLHPYGTRSTAAAMEAAQDLAIVGPYTGSVELRDKRSRTTFFVRADYNQEVHRLIQHALIVGWTRIGIVAPKDPLGEAVLSSVRLASVALGIKPIVIASTRDLRDTVVQPAALEFAKANVQVVLPVLTSTLPQFVRELRAAGSSATVHGLSISSSSAVIAQLASQGRGFGFALVVPSPSQTKYAVVRSYQAAMREVGKTSFSLPSIEGYINTMVLPEGIRKARSEVTRASVIAGLQTIDKLDLGGFSLSYGESLRGSNFVDIAVVGADGVVHA